MKKTIVSESVSKGHPDKIADQISDAILDAYLQRHPNVRTGIETMVKDNIVVLGGEVYAPTIINYDNVVRTVYENLKFPESHHLNPENIKVINLIGQQSPQIHSGVDRQTIGAGDQGFVVGFSTNETPSRLGLGHHIAHWITMMLPAIFNFTGPDCKSQVIVHRDEEGNNVIDNILISTMHYCDLYELRTALRSRFNEIFVGESRKIWEKYIEPRMADPDFLTINPCGHWDIGGPVADCGVTGRKIVVDNYGGYSNVGGGAFSGKDMTKVDRSGAYMARYIANNIVASGLSNTAKVELSYKIGIPEPSSVSVQLDNNTINTDAVIETIKNNFDMTPSGIMEKFDYRTPRNYNLAMNGHFGYYDFDKTILSIMRPWEITDKTECFKNLL